VLAWLSVTALVAAGGVLRSFDATPPPFALFALAVGVVGIAVSCSPLGTLLVRGLPLWVVVLWNFLGFALLVNIVAIAVVSTPLFRWFGEERLIVGR
jgi:hypothetical protein